MIKRSFPLTEEKNRVLKVSNEVLISGVVFTGRDAAH
jgi:tartrate dehydratase beta subunit/fumarate hydratase class I family protein